MAPNRIIDYGATTEPLEDLARRATEAWPSTDGSFQNLLAVIQVRAAIEVAKSAEAARRATTWTMWLAISTGVLAVATIVLAVVAAFRH
jgi:hypothetical protein